MLRVANDDVTLPEVKAAEAIFTDVSVATTVADIVASEVTDDAEITLAESAVAPATSRARAQPYQSARRTHTSETTKLYLVK